MNVRIAVLLVVVVLLASCAPVRTNTVSLPGAWSPQVFLVNAQVVAGGGTHTIQITTPSTCPGSGAENGCIEVAARKVGIIQFVLDGGTARSCEGQDDDTWVWQGIRLTDIANVATSGGTTKKRVGAIKGEAQNDFGADRDGRIDAVTINGQYMSIRNMNSKAYEIWYTLIAMQCGDSTITATSDPRIKNHGGWD